MAEGEWLSRTQKVTGSITSPLRYRVQLSLSKTLNPLLFLMYHQYINVCEFRSSLPPGIATHVTSRTKLVLTSPK